jgi:hypothetical protein
MYKIIDRSGNEVETGFSSFGDALARVKKLEQSGMKNVFAVDATRRVIYKRSANKRKMPKLTPIIR